MPELSKLAIVGLTLIGVGALLVAAYTVYRMTVRTPCPPAPQAASMPVPDVEAQGHESIIPFERKVRGSA